MNQLTAPARDFFNYTIVCEKCKKNYQQIKVPLSIFDNDGNCSLTDQEKLSDHWSYFCFVCLKKNTIDFEKVVNKNTILFLKRKLNLTHRASAIEKELLKINQEIEETKKFIEQNQLEMQLINFHLSNIKLWFFYFCILIR